MANKLVVDQDFGQVIRASRNFNLSEWDCRDGTPIPEELVPLLLPYIKNNIQPIRTFIDAPLHVNSGYRHEVYNKAIKGARRSFHRYGEIPGREGMFATDLSSRALEPVELYQVILGLMRIGAIEPGGIGVYKWGVHYDNRGKGRDPQSAIVRFN